MRAKFEGKAKLYIPDYLVRCRELPECLVDVKPAEQATRPKNKKIFVYHWRPPPKASQPLDIGKEHRVVLGNNLVVPTHNAARIARSIEVASSASSGRAYPKHLCAWRFCT